MAKITPERAAWADMKTRCFNSRHPSYKNYGGRGITVCERWLVFEAFLSDIGPRPSPEHSLDRFPNNDGDYKPGNVRWATYIEQQNNRRDTRFVEVDGVRWGLAEACRNFGYDYNRIHSRINRGQSPQKAFSGAKRAAGRPKALSGT